MALSSNIININFISIFYYQDVVHVCVIEEPVHPRYVIRLQLNVIVNLQCTVSGVKGKLKAQHFTFHFLFIFKLVKTINFTLITFSHPQ